METGHEYIAQLLHDERAGRLRGDAARDRLVRTVAREGKPPRRRSRRLAVLAPIIPLQRRPVEVGEPPDTTGPETQEAVERRTAS